MYENKVSRFLNDQQIIIYNMCISPYLLGGGSIDKAEFAAFFQKEFGATGAQAGKIFGNLDKDGSGDICMNEFKELFKKMDSDGTINNYIYYDILYKCRTEVAQFK